jgi:hypothetical protein
MCVAYIIMTHQWLFCRCVMTLICGMMCKFPCPVCLIPREELGNVLTSYPLRTSMSTQATLSEARSLAQQADKEKVLMSQSLQDVDVSFLLLYLHSQL